MGSIWPAKMVGATAQYLKSHHIKEEVDHIFGIPECKFKTNPKYYTEKQEGYSNALIHVVAPKGWE